MTLQQLTYFLASAEHGSFTGAADALHLSRPSVSEQIANLEAELGVALFVRAGRRLELTDAGRLVRPEAGLVALPIDGDGLEDRALRSRGSKSSMRAPDRMRRVRP